MININKLKGIAVEKGFSVSDLAREIGDRPGTLFAKLNRGTLIDTDIDKIKTALGLTSKEAIGIFFENWDN